MRSGHPLERIDGGKLRCHRRDVVRRRGDFSGRSFGLPKYRGHQHGFLYTGGKYITLDDPLGTSTVATGINDRGQIVGYYTDGAGDFHGFLYSGGKWITLDDPLAANASTAANLAFQNIERQAHALRAPAPGTVVETPPAARCGCDLARTHGAMNRLAA